MKHRGISLLCLYGSERHGAAVQSALAPHEIDLDAVRLKNAFSSEQIQAVMVQLITLVDRSPRVQATFLYGRLSGQGGHRNRPAADGKSLSVLRKDRTPVASPGRYLVVVDSERAVRPNWSPLPVARGH